MYKVHFSDAYTTSAVRDLQGVAHEVDSEVLRFGDAIEVQISSLSSLATLIYYSGMDKECER